MPPSSSGSQILKFWKPYDVLTQFTDTQGRPTLSDYVRIPNVYAAGLLLTDDNTL